MDSSVAPTFLRISNSKYVIRGLKSLLLNFRAVEDGDIDLVRKILHDNDSQANSDGINEEDDTESLFGEQVSEVKSEQIIIERKGGSSRNISAHTTHQHKQRNRLRAGSASNLATINRWRRGLWKKKPLPVALGSVKSLKCARRISLSSLSKKDFRYFNKNCKDQWGRTAMFIAMIHSNMDMIDVLLQNEV